jgi:DNA-directed RNA polymerase subunit A'
MATKKIKSIEFGVLSHDMIRKMSAIEITRAEIYDKDGYPIERGLMDLHLGVISPGLRCKTCGQNMHDCPGHFGHMELIRPVIHAKFSDKLLILLQCTCKECGRILLDDNELQRIMKLAGDVDRSTKEIINLTKDVKKCPHCGAEKPKITIDKPTNFYLNQERFYPSDIMDWLNKIPANDLFLFGYSETLKPQWFILTVLPIPPVTIRPSLALENVVTAESDLTHMLLNIVRINIRLQENIKAGAPQIIIEDLWDLLQYNVTAYFDNETSGLPSAKHRSGRPLNTLAQRLKGKKGRLRYNLIGKRVNAAARSTITPSTDIKIDELGVPKQIADSLTIPEKVTYWNINKCKNYIKEGDVSYIITKTGRRKIVTPDIADDIIETLEEGSTIKRKLKDGDIVIFNRQPTLHKASIMGHKVKVLPGKTFRLNPISTPPYNADYDGDEMNMHVPQSETALAEIDNLMMLNKLTLSMRNGEPIITPAEDLVSGAYLLTRKDTEFSKEEAMEMLYSIGITELPKADRPKGRYSGKLIASQILPKDLNIEYPNKLYSLINQAKGKVTKKDIEKYDCYLRIKNGIILSGVLDERMSKKRNLIEVLIRHYPPETLVDFYYKLSKLVFYTITKKGLTVALDEYNTPEILKTEIDTKVKEVIAQTNGIIKKYENKTLPLFPGKSLDETFESEIINAAGQMKEEISQKILDIKLDEIENSIYPINNNTTLLASIGGSRGKLLNLVNMLGLWGVVTVRTGRPKAGFYDRFLSINVKGTKSLVDYGFVKNNFFYGLSPKEYFIHSIGGRQGEVDTAVATKVSGYLYRRLANALKDLTVGDDLSVRTSNGEIIQYIYGDDGLSPEKAYLGKNINFFHE